MLAVGDFFAAASSNDVFAGQLLDGQVAGTVALFVSVSSYVCRFPVPVPLYVIAGKTPPPARIMERIEKTGGEICPNLYYLGDSGVFSTTSGIKLAFLSGTLSRDEEITGNNNQSYSRKAVVKLVKSLSGSPEIDILLTTEFPRDIARHSSLQFGSANPSTIGVEPIAHLVNSLRPRYHFASSASISFPSSNVFFEREPFENDVRETTEKGAIVTRFIGLASFPELGVKSKEKWFYAFNLVPMAKLDAGILYQKPENTTPSPFAQTYESRSALKRPIESENEGNFFWGDQQSGKKKNASACWFCLSSPTIEKHLLIAIKDECYIASSKGGLSAEGGHILIVPIEHFGSRHDFVDNDTLTKEVEQCQLHIKNQFLLKTGEVPVFFEVFSGRPEGFDAAKKVQHMHIQVVPIPRDLANNIRQMVLQAASTESLVEVPGSVPEDPSIPYFRFEFPDDRGVLVLTLDADAGENAFFNIQFPSAGNSPGRSGKVVLEEMYCPHGGRGAVDRRNETVHGVLNRVCQNLMQTAGPTYEEEPQPKPQRQRVMILKAPAPSQPPPKQEKKDVTPKEPVKAPEQPEPKEPPKEEPRKKRPPRSGPFYEIPCVAFGLAMTFVVSPIFAIIPLCCCLGHAPPSKRAGFNLGVGMGCMLWGGGVLLSAFLAKSIVQAECIEIVSTIIIGQITSASDSTINGTSSSASSTVNSVISKIGFSISGSTLKSLIPQNATSLSQINAQVSPYCAMVVTYTMYGLIAIGSLCVATSLCMCVKSRKMLKLGAVQSFQMADETTTIVREEEHKYLVVVPATSTEEQQSLPSYEIGCIAFGICMTFIVSPVFAIIPLCCMARAPASKRAGFNLGVGVGCSLWGIAMIILAILTQSILLNKCVTLVVNAAMPQVVAAAQNAGVPSNMIQTAVVQNATVINQIVVQATPICSMVLTYAMYGFIALGVICLSASICMCVKSRKMLRRGAVEAVGQNF
ncbi:hypothetical protein HDU82_008846 [Entophlyctis luteolus]|nr:hypothetical protein HDU82_008846 [Entophlyctis luteolus]